MTALNDNRNTDARIGQNPHNGPVKASSKLFLGALIVLSAGYLASGSTATGLVAIGRSVRLVDNSAGANGDLRADVETDRWFLWANGDNITQADVGKTAFIVDDQTVSKGNAGQSPAGIIMAVDAGGVWVHMSEQISRALLAALDAQATADAAAPLASVQYVHGLALVAGDVACATLEITASSVIIPLRETPDATAAHWGDLTITNPTPGSPGSFHIHSASATDTSVVGAIVIG